MPENSAARSFFLTCIAGFTLASLLCGLAPNLGDLVVLRALQGAAGGGLQPTGQAILTDSFPAAKARHRHGHLWGGGRHRTRDRAHAWAAGSRTTTNGAGCSSSMCPWASLSFSSSDFWSARRTRSATGAKGKVDWQGFAFIALALGCLQIVLDRGQEDDWFASGMITCMAIASAICFVLFVWWEWPHENPMVDLKLFKHRDFSVGFVLMAFFGFMILGTTYLLPAYTQSLMGYRATEAGEVIAPGGLLLLLMFPLIGKAVSKVDLRILIGIGLISAAAALWWMTNLYLQASFAAIVLGRCMQTFGLAFLFLPINTLGFRDVPPDRTNYASALVNLARNFGGSIGISFASTLVTRRAQFHQSRLVEHLQSMNPNLADLTRELTPAHPFSRQHPGRPGACLPGGDAAGDDAELPGCIQGVRLDFPGAAAAADIRETRAANGQAHGANDAARHRRRAERPY